MQWRIKICKVKIYVVIHKSHPVLLYSYISLAWIIDTLSVIPLTN